MDDYLLKGIGDAWVLLERDKTVHSRKVFDRIPKENLSPESLGRAEVREQVEKFGCYEISDERPRQMLDALDFLSKIGYLSKRSDRINNVGMNYIAHPYLPHTSPTGVLGITSRSSSPYTRFDLNSGQFELFKESATKFRDQVVAGQHPHIRGFQWGVILSYETDIYELKDRYFDALHVSYSSNDGKLGVWLTEPFAESHEGKFSKNWKRLEAVDSEMFLNDISKVDSLVDGLPWKKKAIGILIYNDEAWTIVPPAIAKSQGEKARPSFLEMPNFLDPNVFSYPN